AVGGLRLDGLAAVAADELRANHRGTVASRLKRLPAQRQVGALEVGPPHVRMRRAVVGTVREGAAEVDVDRLGEVLEDPVMGVVGKVASIRRLEETLGV